MAFICGLSFLLLFHSSAFAQAFPCANSPRAIAVGDFTGDNKMDVAVVRQERSLAEVTNSLLFIYPGNGNGDLQNPIEIGSGLLQPTSVVAGDFGGGHLDLAVAGFVRVEPIFPPFAFVRVGLAILHGDGSGGFAVSQVISFPNFIFSLGTLPTIASGDFNGDGRQDLALVDGFLGLSIFIQNPSGGFSSIPISTSLFTGPSDIAVGNFNGGSNLDLAVTMKLDPSFQLSAGHQAAIFFGNGAGGFPQRATINTGGDGPQSIVSGDFNNDDLPDLAIVHFGSPLFFFPFSDSSNAVSVLLGNGSGGFSHAVGSPFSLPGDGSGASILARDFNGDGKLDLAVATTGAHASDSKVFVLVGDGSGAFEAALEFNPGFPPRSIVAGDFDGDGLPDIAASFFCGTDVKILLNPLPPLDTTPPTVTCSASPDTLWPPNHKLTEVNTTVTVSDSGSGPGGFSLVSVTSNEPDEGLGDGDFPNDIQGFTVGTPDTSGFLRAERSGKGTGRVYTFTYQGTDLAGNSATCNVTVTVPHDQRK